MKNKSISKIKLSVNTEQKAAIRLYKKFGFRQVGRLKGKLKMKGNYYDELIMEKMLQCM